MITLYLMSKKGFYCLQRIIENYPDKNLSVVSARDKSIDHDYYDQIEALCRNNNISFFDRKDLSFRDDAQFSIAVSWRWLINKDIGRLIVLHDSLLPRYRGFNPLVSCLVNAEREIGVSGIFSSPQYDEGDIIYQASIKIDYPVKIAAAIDMILACYKEVILQILDYILKGHKIPFCKQNHELATYSLWRDEQDYKVDWQQDSGYIKRFIDAVGPPYHCAFAMLNQQKIRIMDAEVVPDVKIENRHVGKVIFIEGTCPIIVCGAGLIKITNAVFEESKINALPLPNFRARLT